MASRIGKSRHLAELQGQPARQAHFLLDAVLASAQVTRCTQ